MTTTIHQPPALDGDSKVHPRGKIERRVVWNLLKHLEAHGFYPVLHCDGEEDVRIENGDHKQVMELTFNLDECRVYFARSPNARINSQIGSVLIVLGNDGWDSIADWSWAANSDGTAFNAAMDAFDGKDYA